MEYAVIHTYIALYCRAYIKQDRKIDGDAPLMNEEGSCQGKKGSRRSPTARNVSLRPNQRRNLIKVNDDGTRSIHAHTALKSNWLST
jgi:hypothetical protein